MARLSLKYYIIHFPKTIDKNRIKYFVSIGHKRCFNAFSLVYIIILLFEK